MNECDGDGLGQLTLLRKFEFWLFHRSSWASFVTLIGALFVLRAGFSADHADADMVAFARSFPEPTRAYTSWAVLSPAIGNAVGATTLGRWLLLHAAIAGVVFAAVVLLLRRRLGRTTWRFALIWVSLLSAPAVIPQWFGVYDVWMLFGGALLGLGLGVPSAVLGGLILGASNAEQGVLAIVALACVAVARLRVGGDLVGRREIAIRLCSAAFSLMLARVLIMFWFSNSGVAVDTRGGRFFDLLPTALENNLKMGTLGVYGWLGIGWVAVALCLWAIRSDRASLVMVSCGLVALPAVATISTTDGTRVFAMITWPALLAVVAWRLEAERSVQSHERWFERIAPFALLASPILPSLVTGSAGWVQSPWHYAVTKLFA